MPQAPQPSNDSEVTIDSIYANLGAEQSDDQPGLSEETGEVSGHGGDAGGQEETQPQSTEHPQEAPLQPSDTDLSTLRLHNEQLTRTYIPALERERDRALHEAESLRAHVAGLQNFQTQLTSHGLTPDEATIGLQMAAAYKANPTQFIANIIRNAQANGVEVPQGTPNPGLDANTLSRVIDARLAPLLAPLQQQRAEQEQSYLLRNHIDNFYAQYPDARVHEQSLAAFINNQTRMGISTDLPTAYIELYKWAHSNGYDWSQPLPAQVIARRSAPPQPNLGPRRSINGANVVQTPTQHDPNKSWKQIVAEAVAENM